MSSQASGLQNFISDLRNAKSKVRISSIGHERSQDKTDKRMEEKRLDAQRTQRLQQDWDWRAFICIRAHRHICLNWLCALSFDWWKCELFRCLLICIDMSQMNRCELFWSRCQASKIWTCVWCSVALFVVVCLWSCRWKWSPLAVCFGASALVVSEHGLW